MIDSINFIIRNVSYIDFWYLRQIGIDIKEFKPKKYTRNTENMEFEARAYSFVYESVHFQFYTQYEVIIVKTTTHKLLDKKDVRLKDAKAYKIKLHQIMQKVFNYNNVQLELHRLDYCVDIKLEEKIKKIYLNLYRWNNPKFGNMKIQKIYKTSVYRQSKRGQFNLNIYSRYEFTGDEEDRDIFRIELQMKKAKIKKEYDKYGIDKNIDNYWSKDSMEEYYFKYLKDFFGIGQHYKLSIAKNIIDSSDYSNKYKEKLKRFLTEMTMEVDYRQLARNKLFSIETIKKYIEMLGNLNINTICLYEVYDGYDVIPNLLDIAKEVAEVKYFI